MGNESEDKLDMGNSALSERQVLNDLETLYNALSRLEQLNEDEDLDPAERSKQIVAEISKVEAVYSKYEADEDREVLVQAIEKADIDTDVLQNILTKSIEIIKQQGKDSAATADQFEKIVERLKPLYQATENMRGLSDDEKIKRYETFLEEYVKEGLPLAANEDNEWLFDQLNRRLGIPPNVFADHGAEYIAIKARQLKDMVEKADTYSMADARGDLQKQGIDKPSQQQIEEHYVSEKKDLYQEAKDFYDRTDQQLFTDKDDMQRLQNQAHVSVQYLDNQIETLELHEQELELRAEEPKRAATTPAPVPTPASAPAAAAAAAPASATQESLPISTAAWQNSAGTNLNSMKV